MRSRLMARLGNKCRTMYRAGCSSERGVWLPAEAVQGFLEVNVASEQRLVCAKDRAKKLCENYRESPPYPVPG